MALNVDFTHPLRSFDASLELTVAPDKTTDLVGPSGDGKTTVVTVPGITGPVRVVSGAFSHYHEADEYVVGANYYFKRHDLKWQTDFGVYQGGNPAGGGVSAAGWIAGLDGWMLRTQIQFAF